VRLPSVGLLAVILPSVRLLAVILLSVRLLSVMLLVVRLLAVEGSFLGLKIYILKAEPQEILGEKGEAYRFSSNNYLAKRQSGKMIKLVCSTIFIHAGSQLQ
jgi:hypothetical protein